MAVAHRPPPQEVTPGQVASGPMLTITGVPSPRLHNGDGEPKISSYSEDIPTAPPVRQAWRCQSSLRTGLRTETLSLSRGVSSLGLSGETDQ